MRNSVARNVIRGILDGDESPRLANHDGQLDFEIKFLPTKYVSGNRMHSSLMEENI